MKNFFWFLREPLDERENEVYLKAYKRAFSVMTGVCVLLAVFLFALAKKSGIYSGAPEGFRQTSHYILGSTDKYLYFSSVLILFLFLVMMSGWTTLRSEELSNGRRKEVPPNKYLYGSVITLVFVLPILTSFIRNLLPGLQIDVFIAWQTITYLWLIVLVWLYSPSYNLFERLFFIILYPLISLLYILDTKSKGNVIRIVKSLVKSIGLLILVWFVLQVSDKISHKIFNVPRITYHTVETNSFEPHTMKGSTILLEMCTDCLLKEDSYVLSRKGGISSFTLLRVLEVNSEKNTILVTDGSSKFELNKENVFAKGPVKVDKYGRRIPDSLEDPN